MSELTIISVNGSGGVISDADRLEQERYEVDSAAQNNITSHGPPGFDARTPTEGEPGGYLNVALSRSTGSAGGIRVDILENGSLHVLPPVWEIPSGGIVRFEARGGDGEAGRDGGNGFDGRPGPDGVAATRDTDATDGANGGDGGIAGSGTYGADGGNGGSIDILVDEDMTHLLIAVEWDTRGGSGGPPGHHGKPGKGGPGGKGGAAHEWEEFLGYRYNCTANCRGLRGQRPQPPIQNQIMSGLQALDLVRPVRQQVVSGSNLNRVIAAAAQRQRDLTRAQQASTGYCRCAGGTGDCVGCQRITVNTNLKRGVGRGGHPGHPGAPAPQTILGPGIRGRDGEGQIIVQRADGRQSTYHSRYRLELIGFDVTDENQDGIFEPGEHILVQHVRIRNTGGMPSPTCPIPLTIIGSEWIEPLENEEGRLYLSQSIQIGESVTLDGVAKARIRRLDRPIKSGKALLEKHTISLRATMPWLDRELPLFTFNRTIDIQHPLELVGFSVLPTLTPASRNKLTMKLHNKSSKAYGGASELCRPITVSLSFPSDTGNLVSEGADWNNLETENVSLLAPKGSLDIHQIVGVSAGAEHNSRAKLRINLFISYPDGEMVDGEALPLQLIHQIDFSVKISSPYEYHSDAAFVVVTNSGDPNENVKALRRFIEDELKLKMDLWNLGLYGGLQYPCEEGETTARTVLSSYSGKSIIFLGNEFDYFGHGKRNALQLCDIMPLAQASQNGTSCLFLGYSDAASRNHLKKFIFPLSHRLSESAHEARESTHFSTKKEFLKSIQEQREVGMSAFTTYTVLVRSSTLGGNQAVTKREAESIAKLLHEQMPQERFLVSSLYPIPNTSWDFNSTGEGKIRKQRDCGLVVIYRGLSQNKSIRMTNSYPVSHIQHVGGPPNENNFPSLGQVQTSPQSIPQLDPFDAYMCVASLSLSDRIVLLCGNGESKEEINIRSAFVLQAAELSLLEELNEEICILLRQAPWPDPLDLQKDANVALSLHFSNLATVLLHPNVIALKPLPERFLKIFRYTLASSFPEKKRQMAKDYVVPFGDRRAQVRQFLTTTIDGFLKGKRFSEKDLGEFHSQARSLKSPTDGKKRHVSKIIRQEVAALTRKSGHGYAGSCKTTRDIVAQTRYCEEAEWDATTEDVQEFQQKIAKDIARAREVLEEMTDV